MNIVDIATQEFIAVDSGDRLGTVRSTFEERNPKGIIVTSSGEYGGVITQKQLLQSHVEDSTKVAALKRSAPRIGRDADVREVARMLVEGDTKIAPVFEDDQLWGVVTDDSILRAVLDNLDALTVGDIYTDDPITITEDTTAGTIINRMRENGISRLPVCSSDGHPNGVVTIRDIVDVVVRHMETPTRGEYGGERQRMLDLPASDVMSSPVETVETGVSLKDAVGTMLERDFAGLVVTNADDRIDGVVTKTDVLRALSYTEEEHLDVQITNIKLLDTLDRQEIREAIEEIASKYSDMNVHHAHVRFHQHKEKLRGNSLIRAQIRLRSNRGQIAGSGEGYGASNAFYVAIDKLERNVLERKGMRRDEEYRGQLLRKLGEI